MIQVAVSHLPGVEKIDGDVQARTITLRFLEDRTTLEEISQAMGQAGYSLAE